MTRLIMEKSEERKNGLTGAFAKHGNMSAIVIMGIFSLTAVSC